MWWKLMEDGEKLLWSVWSKAIPGGDKWAETMWKRKREEKLYIKCPGSRSSYWTGPEGGGGHIWGLPRIRRYPVWNQSKDMSGRCGKGNWVWWRARAGLLQRSDHRSFCSGWKGAEVPRVSCSELSWCRQPVGSDSSHPLLPAAVILAVQWPCCEDSKHAGPAPPFPGAGFDSSTTCTMIFKQERHEGTAAA